MVTTTRHGAGLRWQARWVDHDGNERSKSFLTKATAKHYVRSVLADLQTGSYADPRRSAVTFGAVAETWIRGKDTANRAPKTVAGYQGLLDVVILPVRADGAQPAEHDVAAGLHDALTDDNSLDGIGLCAGSEVGLEDRR